MPYSKPPCDKLAAVIRDGCCCCCCWTKCVFIANDGFVVACPCACSFAICCCCCCCCWGVPATNPGWPILSAFPAANPAAKWDAASEEGPDAGVPPFKAILVLSLSPFPTMSVRKPSGIGIPMGVRWVCVCRDESETALGPIPVPMWC